MKQKVDRFENLHLCNLHCCFLDHIFKKNLYALTNFQLKCQSDNFFEAQSSLKVAISLRYFPKSIPNDKSLKCLLIFYNTSITKGFSSIISAVNASQSVSLCSFCFCSVLLLFSSAELFFGFCGVIISTDFIVSSRKSFYFSAKQFSTIKNELLHDVGLLTIFSK